MSQNINDYLKTLNETRALSRYCLDNQDLIMGFTTEEKVALMGAVQIGVAALSAVEKRLRGDLIEEFDCELGKSKTHRAFGFKIDAKRPTSDKLDQTQMDRLKVELGDRFEDLFNVEYKVINKELKDAGVDEEAIVRSAMTTKEGSVAVKLTKLEDF